MRKSANCIGIVLCGGKSTRMGSEKGLLMYHGKPQAYHLYDLLNELCDETVIACNANQLKTFDSKYNLLTDDLQYSGIGPMAAVLTAYTNFRCSDLLIAGCDYPFLDKAELNRFMEFINESIDSAAFYNTEQKAYEPTLAFYPFTASVQLFAMFRNQDFSLQKYLKASNARKYIPANNLCMQSVNTPEDYDWAKQFIDSHL